MSLRRYTTIARSIWHFWEEVRRTYPELKIVYAENTEDYTTAVSRYRQQANMENETGAPLPLIAFNRSTFLKSTNMRDRASKNSYIDKNTGLCIRAVFGRLDIGFTLFTNDMDEFENFEISYYSEDFLANVKSMTVSYPDINLNDLTYQFDHKPVEVKTFSIDDNFYQSLTGSFSIEGFFLAIEGSATLIEKIIEKTEINTELDFNNKTAVTTNLDLNVVAQILIEPE